ncbi:hypothetical protein, partial [Streptosporangium amethystogenes]|uniref:hypothetical protein n=1 Tax=Streptosporangium amethystogenes TaxID=2002 RepID=UPI0004C514D8
MSKVVVSKVPLAVTGESASAADHGDRAVSVVHQALGTGLVDQPTDQLSIRRLVFPRHRGFLQVCV